MCSVLELWNRHVPNRPSQRCSLEFVLQSCHFLNDNTLSSTACRPKFPLEASHTRQDVGNNLCCLTLPRGKKKRRRSARRGDERKRLQGEDVMTEGYKAGVDWRSEMEQSGRRAAGRLAKTWHSVCRHDLVRCWAKNSAVHCEEMCFFIANLLPKGKYNDNNGHNNHIITHTFKTNPLAAFGEVVVS